MSCSSRKYVTSDDFDPNIFGCKDGKISIQPDPLPTASVFVASGQPCENIEVNLGYAKSPDCALPGGQTAGPWTLKNGLGAVIASGDDLAGVITLPNLCGEPLPFEFAYQAVDACGTSFPAETFGFSPAPALPSATIILDPNQWCGAVETTLGYAANPSCPTPGVTSSAYTVYDVGNGDAVVASGTTLGLITLPDLCSAVGPFRIEATVTDACGQSATEIVAFSTVEALPTAGIDPIAANQFCDSATVTFTHTSDPACPDQTQNSGSYVIKDSGGNVIFGPTAALAGVTPLPDLCAPTDYTGQDLTIEYTTVDDCGQDTAISPTFQVIPVAGTKFVPVLELTDDSPIACVSNGDPLDVALLVTGNDATIVDESLEAHTIQTFGNVQTSTNDYKFGGSSVYFDGTGDYFDVSDGAPGDSFDFGTGDFTIEMWVKPEGFGGNSSIYDSRPTGAGAGPHIYLFHSNTTLNLFSSVSQSAAGVITLDKWQHVALSRVSGIMYGFVNGVIVFQAADATNYANTVAKPRFGSRRDGVGNYYNGYMDDIRVTSGTGRYSAPFTPQGFSFRDTFYVESHEYNGQTYLSVPDLEAAIIAAEPTTTIADITCSGGVLVTEVDTSFVPTEVYLEKIVLCNDLFGESDEFLTKEYLRWPQPISQAAKTPAQAASEWGATYSANVFDTAADLEAAEYTKSQFEGLEEHLTWTRAGLQWLLTGLNGSCPSINSSVSGSTFSPASTTTLVNDLQFTATSNNAEFDFFCGYLLAPCDLTSGELRFRMTGTTGVNQQAIYFWPTNGPVGLVSAATAEIHYVYSLGLGKIVDESIAIPVTPGGFIPIFYIIWDSRDVADGNMQVSKDSGVTWINAQSSTDLENAGIGVNSTQPY